MHRRWQRCTTMLCLIQDFAVSFRHFSPNVLLHSKYYTTKFDYVVTHDENKMRKMITDIDKELKLHDHNYYTLGTPTITDFEYDKLIAYAQNITSKYPDLRNLVSKFTSVGSSLSSNAKQIKHLTPMLSLKSTNTKEGLEKFLNEILEKSCNKKLDIVIEPKIDGCSLSIIYKNGKIYSAATRGDGNIGEDVLSTILEMNDIPKHVDVTNFGDGEILEVRGEVYLSTKDFIDINMEIANNALKKTSGNEEVPMNDGQKNENGTLVENATKTVEKVRNPLSNARNAVAGALRSASNKQLKSRLSFFAYNLISYPQQKDNVETFYNVSSQTQTLTNLKAFGFKVAYPQFEISSDTNASTSDQNEIDEDIARTTANEIWEIFSRIEEHRNELGYGYDLDGIVVKVNDPQIQQSMGMRNTSPKWALAIKFNSLEAITKLLSINIQVGRTGALTPVAILEPVNMGGVIVQRATLHNQHEINRLKLRTGSIVRLQRAGDVIPKIMGLAVQDNSEDGQEYQLPSSCPVCGSTVSFVGSVARCTGGYTCAAQSLEKISHYCSRNAANIKGVGPSTLETLLDNKLISSICDLYTLESRQLALSNISDTNNGGVRLSTIAGFGEVTEKNIYRAIEASKHQLTFSRLLFGLGVRQVGLETSKLIEKEFNSNFSVFWSYLKEESDKVMNGDKNLNLTKDHENAAQRLLNIAQIGNACIDQLIDFARPTRIGGQRERVDELLQFVNPSATSSSTLTPKTASSNETPDATSFLSNDNSNSTADTGDDASVDIVAGRKVAFTGKFNSMTREEAKNMCVALGGQVVESFSVGKNQKISSYLLVRGGNGDKHVSGSKEKSAIKLGIEVWTEEKWLRSVGRKP